MADGIDAGIAVTEIAPGDGPVEVAIETIAAFIGRALRGPLNTPVLVRTFGDFRRRFGGAWRDGNLASAVEQFFEHGGRQLYVVRVANNARGAMICLPASHGVLVLRAREPGSTESIRAAIDYDGLHDDDEEHFNLTLQRVAAVTGLVVDQEIHRRLSCREDDKAFIGHVLSSSSLAVPRTPLPAGRPMPTTDPHNRFDPGYVGHAEDGSDGLGLTDYDLIGSAVTGSGLFSLNRIEHFDLLYLPPPGPRDLGPAAHLAAERYCRHRGAMLIMDPPADWDSAAKAIAGTRHAGYASPNMLTYFPRIRIRDARDEHDLPACAAGGAIAGLLCKRDRLYGPWKEFDDNSGRFSRQLVPAIALGEEDTKRLVREGLNVIAGSAPGKPSGPAALHGSVTLARNSRMERSFARLPVQRLVLSITNAIERATRWAVFETNAGGVAERIQRPVQAYLSYLSEAGAFADDHFVVQCDAGPPARPGHPCRGVTILLAFHPTGADEAVSLTLHQTISGCSVTTTAFAPSTARCA